MGVNKYNIGCHCVRVASRREERSNRNDWDCFVVPPRNDILGLIMPTYLPAFNNLSEISNHGEVSLLSDAKVIELANLKMDVVQNQRLGELQAKGKNTGLTEAEGYELLVLMSIYQMGQLRKSMALAEAVKRGLREPLLP